MRPVFIFLLLCCSPLWGANYSAEPAGRLININSFYIGPAYGYHFLPLASLNAQLSTYGVNGGFGNAMSLGVDYSRHFSVNRYASGVCSYYSVQWLLPQVVSTPGDSLTFTLKGYAAQFDVSNLDFVQSQKVTFTMGLAWAFGRLKIVEEEKNGGNSSSFYNTYFAPEFRAELSFRLGKHVFFGMRYAYRQDISKTGWKRTGAPQPDLPGTRLNGTSAGTFIGFGF